VASGSFFGFIMSLLFVLIAVYIAYVVIQLAVRHGIDSSETNKLLKELVKNFNNNNEDN